MCFVAQLGAWGPTFLVHQLVCGFHSGADIRDQAHPGHSGPLWGQWGAGYRSLQVENCGFLGLVKSLKHYYNLFYSINIDSRYLILPCKLNFFQLWWWLSNCRTKVLIFYELRRKMMITYNNRKQIYSCFYTINFNFHLTQRHWF